jgi:hypothetical protein
MSTKALHTFPQSVGIAGRRPSSSYYLFGSQADNLFYLDPHHTRATIPLQPPMQTAECERECGIRIRHYVRKGICIASQASSFPDAPRIQLHGLLYLFVSNCIAITFIKQLPTGSSSSGSDHVRGNSAGANGGAPVLSGEASDAGGRGT